MKKPKRKRSKNLSLHPMKPEEALKRFMEADPKRVEKGMRRLRHRGVSGSALSTG